MPFWSELWVLLCLANSLWQQSEILIDQARLQFQQKSAHWSKSNALCVLSSPSLCFGLPLRWVDLLKVLVGWAWILGSSNRIQPSPGYGRGPALSRPVTRPAPLVRNVRQGAASERNKKSYPHIFQEQLERDRIPLWPGTIWLRGHLHTHLFLLSDLYWPTS